jgi:hypothetical protein
VFPFPLLINHSLESHKSVAQTLPTNHPTNITFLPGSFSYSYATGKTSLEDGAADIKDDAVFLLASQTKLLTAVAALQIVEKGLIALDDDVEEIVPELAEQKVLTGFNEDGEPVLEARTEPITFRYENLPTPSKTYIYSVLT